MAGELLEVNLAEVVEALLGMVVHPARVALEATVQVSWVVVLMGGKVGSVKGWEVLEVAVVVAAGVERAEMVG